MRKSRAGRPALVSAPRERILLIERQRGFIGRVERLAIEVRDDARHVVVPARCIGQIDEPLHELGQWTDARHLFADRVVVDEAAQAVGAQQHAVASAKLDKREIDGDLLGGSERLQDDVRMLERFGFVFGELTGFDEAVTSADLVLTGEGKVAVIDATGTVRSTPSCWTSPWPASTGCPPSGACGSSPPIPIA